MAFRSSFLPDEIGREREVIFEEARIEQDNPRSAIVRQLYGLVFAGNPYGRPVLGTRQTMQAATQERLRAFNRRYYVPENMTLVVAGPVDPVAVRGIVDRTFGRMPATGYKPDPGARARAARGRGAPHRGARRAAGPPGPRLAGPALGRRQRRRGGSARHDPRGHRELAAGPAAARQGAAGLDRDHELLGAHGRRHREPAGGARGQGPGAGGAHHPGGDRADPGERAHRGGAPPRGHQVRGAARLRHRDLRGPGLRLRPRRDHLDARRGAALRGPAPAHHPRADPGRGAPVSLAHRLRAAGLRAEARHRTR